eukprot:jgi/Bigna1/81073/fgenesh1_pg.77_\
MEFQYRNAQQKDSGGTRTRNRLIRSQAPYPLGHGTRRKVMKEGLRHTKTKRKTMEQEELSDRSEEVQLMEAEEPREGELIHEPEDSKMEEVPDHQEATNELKGSGSPDVDNPIGREEVGNSPQGNASAISGGQDGGDDAKRDSAGTEEHKRCFLSCEMCTYPIIEAGEFILERAEIWSKAVYAYQLEVLNKEAWCYSATNPNANRFDVIRAYARALYSESMHLGWAFSPASVQQTESSIDKSSSTNNDGNDDTKRREEKQDDGEEEEEDEEVPVDTAALTPPAASTTEDTKLVRSLPQTTNSSSSATRSIGGAGSDDSEGVDGGGRREQQAEQMEEIEDEEEEAKSAAMAAGEADEKADSSEQREENTNPGEGKGTGGGPSEDVSGSAKIEFFGLIVTRMRPRTLTEAELEALESKRREIRSASYWARKWGALAYIQHEYADAESERVCVVSSDSRLRAVLNMLPTSIASGFFPAVQAMSHTPRLRLEISSIYEAAVQAWVQWRASIQEGSNNGGGNSEEGEGGDDIFDGDGGDYDDDGDDPDVHQNDDNNDDDNDDNDDDDNDDNDDDA